MKRLVGLFLLVMGLCLCLQMALAEAVTSTSFAENRISVEFLDVGQGDAILIRSPEGKTALIDAGPPQNGFVALLKNHGVKQIDLAVITHHHTDHIGNMAAVLEEFKPKAFLDSNSSHSTKKYQGVLRAVAAAGSEVISPFGDKERPIKLGSVLIRVFPQPPEDEEDENNNSIGMRVQFGKFSVLLTGDSREEERAWWIKNAPKELYRKATVLLLPQHGSIAGIDWEWLEATSPKIAVASSSYGNRYGPHLRTLKMLSMAKVDLLRTDTAGTITITSDGESWKIAKEKNAD
jgi:beta-lactamase superfamily II metal-dependent hydrolase